MRLITTFDAFDKEEERENIVFHDTPDRKHPLAQETLEVSEKFYNHDEQHRAFVDNCAKHLGIELNVVSHDTFGRDVSPEDTFVVVVADETTGKLRCWFGYWQPFTANFLRERGTEAPYKMVQPTLIRPNGEVIHQGHPDAPRIIYEEA